MAEIQLKVTGMSCGHCKAAVEKAVKRLDGIQSVEATPGEDKVVVVHDGSVSIVEIKNTIQEEGYVVVE
ncbi:cation transporter [Desulforamulus aquiferis]|uniref:Cation transporter n=1 Tax=Desulforamulus aquiferis TaxID=1397668 RepID=A0AAW7Z9Y1_9FIRM|nr:cation transporter [Desulforamulus aquiferis]MDO7786131.1 cation transporter [Desulforamulus aquiferis]RYD04485.1 hypothetical protein N752_14020 [Desulforamulus aquiferis]